MFTKRIMTTHLLQRYLLVTPISSVAPVFRWYGNKMSPTHSLKFSIILTSDRHGWNVKLYIVWVERNLIYLCLLKMISCTIWGNGHKNSLKPHSSNQTFFHCIYAWVYTRTQWFPREDTELQGQWASILNPPVFHLNLCISHDHLLGL